MAVVNQRGYIQQQRIIKKPYFVGFNTVDHPTPPYSLTNLDLVKRDLLNQFSTPIGTRVMLPQFGTYIYDYLFDPFDEFTKNKIINDVVRVVQSDPRVQLVNVDVSQENQTITILINLYFIPESVTDNLFVTFSLKDKETF